MISLTCNKCRATLEVDDAFAGSACRCHICGTIQTVPGKKRAAQPAGAGPRTLYSNESRVAGAGTGLDALADVVASSGLHQQVVVARKGEAAAERSVPIAWVVGIGVAAGVVILGLLMIVLMVMRGPAKHESVAVSIPPIAANAEPGSAPPPALTPQFVGIDLAEPSVVFVIDRGSSARESFGHAQAAVLRSIRSLGTNRKFQILFWDNGQADGAYPAGAPMYATPQALGSAQRAMEAVVAFGRSDAIPAIKRAIANKPGAVVLITAKGWELDDAFGKAVLAVWSGSGVKIHTVSIGGGGSDILEQIARSTGGTHKSVTGGELKRFAEQ